MSYMLYMDSVEEITFSAVTQQHLDASKNILENTMYDILPPFSWISFAKVKKTSCFFTR